LRIQLTKTIPSLIGTLFPDLIWLEFAGNKLIGTISSSIGFLARLKVLKLVLQPTYRYHTIFTAYDYEQCKIYQHWLKLHKRMDPVFHEGINANDLFSIWIVINWLDLYNHSLRDFVNWPYCGYIKMIYLVQLHPSLNSLQNNWNVFTENCYRGSDSYHPCMLRQWGMKVACILQMKNNSLRVNVPASILEIFFILESHLYNISLVIGRNQSPQVGRISFIIPRELNVLV
jgi:hypothetical protein